MATLRSPWTIAILGNYFTYNDIVQALYVAGIPSCVSFKYDPNPTGKYKIEYWADWGRWPFPIDSISNYIVLFSSQDSRFAQGGGYGGGTIGSRISVQIWPSDSAIAIGQRIWHEILHGMGIDVDRAMDADTAAFCQYLRDNGSSFAGRFCDESTRQYMSSHYDWHNLLCEYNTFQMKRYFSSQCYGVIPAPIEPEPVIVEPEPVIVEPEPVIVEPEPVETIPTDECVNGSFSCKGTTRTYCANGRWVDYQYYSTQCGYVQPETTAPSVYETQQQNLTNTEQGQIVYVTPTITTTKKIVVIEQPAYSQSEVDPGASDSYAGMVIVAVGALLVFSLIS